MTTEAWQLSGSSSGPTVLITGGECEGPAAIALAVQELETKPLAGTVIAIPMCDPFGPEISAVAHEADYWIDLRSGGSDYLSLPSAGFYDEASYEAARRFGLPVLQRLQKSGAIRCEYLGAGQLSREVVEAYRRGILSCLAFWGLLPGEEPLAPQGEAYAGDWTLAEAEGLFWAETKLGDLVGAGELLATIRDLRGDVLQSFVAPHAGMVLAIRSKAHIHSGDRAILLGTHV